MSLITRIASLTKEVRDLQQKLAVDPEADLMKSLNSLIKGNQGRFKSPRQAKFLWEMLKGRHSKNELAKRWGRQYTGTDPNAFSAMLIALDPRFGRRDPTRIRYYGRAYVIDGAGVVAAAKVKIRHPKAGEKEVFAPESVGQVDFVRSGEAPVLYDASGAQKKLEEKVKKLQPMIDKVKALPDYRHEDILQDFVRRMEDGRELTPGQLGVLRKYMDVDVGDPKEWLRLYEEGIKLYEKKLIDPAVNFFKTTAAPNENLQKSFDFFATETQKEWNEFKRKPKPTWETSHTEASRLAEEAGWRHERGVTGPLDALARLHQAAKKGKKAPRTALKVVPVAIRLVEWLRSVSPTKIVSKLEAEFPKASKPDPFGGFGTP